MINPLKKPAAEASPSGWRNLYLVGGAAALVAGILFRRNLAVEISMFGSHSPATVSDWFELLQNNRLMGLINLHVFDVVNYVLVGLMFLALYAALKREHQSSMTVAVAFAFLGIAVYFAANTAFSMLSLSDQFAAATTEAERTQLLASGQALLALNRFCSGAHPGSGGLISLFMVAVASMIASFNMVRSTLFCRAAGYVGIAASALDLLYCTAYIFVPAAGGDLLAVSFIPAAGLLFMVWHIMAGWKLVRLGRNPRLTSRGESANV